MYNKSVLKNSKNSLEKRSHCFNDVETPSKTELGTNAFHEIFVQFLGTALLQNTSRWQLLKNEIKVVKFVVNIYIHKKNNEKIKGNNVTGHALEITYLERIHLKAFAGQFYPYPLLIHLFPMHPFSTPWKHQKIARFFDVFRGWRKGVLGTNGLNSLRESHSLHLVSDSLFKKPLKNVKSFFSDKITSSDYLIVSKVILWGKIVTQHMF